VYVEELRLSGFRNLSDLVLQPHPAVNVIWGDNAQGKTNLLEAIWLFTGARSFRGARDGDYIRFGGQGAKLSLSFFAEGRSQTAELAFGAESDKKQVFLNGIKLERRSLLSGRFCAVVFSPDHLDLIKKEPQKRRSLLDTSLCQAYPKYEKVLDSYERILRQRAVVLKDAQLNYQLIDMLEVWDASLVEYAGYITWMRMRYTQKLAAYAAEVYDGISSGRESFSVRYLSSCGPMPEQAERAQVTALVEAAVRKSRDQDIKLAKTHVGPHRDDLEIEVNGKSARSFGSQGQQRSCVLALKLAECRILEEGMKEPPVVLLDDVMSELDEGRRNYLLNHLVGRQVFITCCDDDMIASLNGGKVFYVSGGMVVSSD